VTREIVPTMMTEMRAYRIDLVLLKASAEERSLPPMIIILIDRWSKF
jgi:hypothetical protein